MKLPLQKKSTPVSVDRESYFRNGFADIDKDLFLELVKLAKFNAFFHLRLIAIKNGEP